MRYRRAVGATIGALVLAVSCGTTGASLRDEQEARTATTATSTTGGPAPTSSAPPPTTTAGTTTTATTTSVTTTTTTPTSTVPPVPMQFDEDGVPVNGQTSGVVLTPTGRITPAFGPTADGGWRVWSPCGRETVIDDGELIESADIVLDPGHGGSDEPGSVGPNGLRESDLNLAVAERTASALRAAGYSVIMTRSRDERVPIVTRAEIALALQPVAFISIHHNAGTDAPSPTPGTEVYHQVDDADSKRLAGLLIEEARAALTPLDASWVSMSDAGAMARTDRDGDDYYGVLRRSAGVTSVLVELAYLSNESEADLLARPEVQESLAASIVAAVERFTDTDDPGSGFTDDPIFRGYGPSGAGRTEGCVDPPLQ